MNEGYISIHRQILDNPISSKPLYLSVWIYLLCNANHTDRHIILNNQKILIKRGSFLGSIAKIAKHFNVSRSQISNTLDYFEKDKMLYTKRTQNYTIFQVLNYDRFQGAVHKKNTASTPPDTTNNDNNDNNINIPDWLSEKSLDEFIEHRKKIKKPMTSLAVKKFILKLEKLHNKNYCVQDMLDEAIEQGWQTVYETNHQPKTISTRNIMDRL